MNEDYDLKMDEFNPDVPGHRHFLSMHGGSYHGRDGLGVMDIEFPDMSNATSWVSVYNYEKRTFLRDSKPGRSFADKVVISVYPEGW